MRKSEKQTCIYGREEHRHGRKNNEGEQIAARKGMCTTLLAGGSVHRGKMFLK